MTQTLSQAGASMYEQAGGADDFDPNGAVPGSETADDETTVEGEFREVGDN